MMAAQYFTIEQCISVYNISPEFLEEIISSGILTLSQTEGGGFVDEEAFHTLEELSRWHNDLEINVAGIEALYFMRQRMNELIRQNQLLRNNLDFYHLRFPPGDFSAEFD